MREWAKQKSEESEERERENGKVIDKREREKGMGERNLSFFLFLTFSSFSQTPLYNAAREGSVECVNTLIKHGADVTVKNVRSERVCESASHRRIEVWGFV